MRKEGFRAAQALVRRSTTHKFLSSLSTLFPHPMRIPNHFSIYSPALQREIARRSTAKNVASRHTKATRTLSTSTTLPRPYTFHIGASWAGKVDRDLDKRFKIPFSPDGPIGSWRDKMLSRPKAVKSLDAGEDFFFVQEVRLIDRPSTVHTRGVPYLVLTNISNIQQMRNGSVCIQPFMN